MKNARIICKDHIEYNGTIFHVEAMTYSHADWMSRNGLQETETVETVDGEKFTIFANYARCLACAIPA